jgi:hypothetical protein
MHRCCDAILKNPGGPGLGLTDFTALLRRFTDWALKAVSALPYQGPSSGFWFCVRAACEAFFSVETAATALVTAAGGRQAPAAPAPTVAHVVLDAWGELLLGRTLLQCIEPAQWAPEAAAVEAERPRVRAVALEDTRRAMRRYLHSTACRLLVEHLDSPRTIDGVKAAMPCPAWSTYGECRDRRSGRCLRLHERSTSAAQGRHLALVVEQCCAVSALLVMKKALARGVPDRLGDKVLSRVMPLRRLWFEKLARGLQPVSQRLESCDAVFGCIAALPMEACFGLVELAQDVWLADSTAVADAGTFLKATLLLARLTGSPAMQTPPTKALQDKCNGLVLAATRQYAGHYAFVRDPSCGAVRSVHSACLLFWTCLERGAAASALRAGLTYLAFIDKYLRDPNVAPSLNPRPDDLIELVELLVALCVTCYKAGHNVVLPRSYLLPFFCRQNLCFAPEGLGLSYNAYAASMESLPELERHAFSILQGMVQGRVFAAMRPAEQKRQASFDDWRDLCARASLALVLLVAHCREQAQLQSTLDRIHSLASLDVDPGTMGKFRFPRRERETFLGRDAADLLERVGRWYADGVDGLLAVVRADFDPRNCAGWWRPASAERVVFAPSAARPVVLFSRLDNCTWMAKRPWIEGGAEEWLVEQERRAAGGIWEKASQDGGRVAEAEGSLENQSEMQLLMSADFQRKDQVSHSLSSLRPLPPLPRCHRSIPHVQCPGCALEAATSIQPVDWLTADPHLHPPPHRQRPASASGTCSVSHRGASELYPRRRTASGSSRRRASPAGAPGLRPRRSGGGCTGTGPCGGMRCPRCFNCLLSAGTDNDP